jgi:hypothetical protein
LEGLNAELFLGRLTEASGQGAKVDTAQWRSHQWAESVGERIENVGKKRRRFNCTACGRAFVTDDTGNRKWAINQYQKVYFGEFGEQDAALEEEVSKRWLEEPCPRRFLTADNADRKKIPNVEP